MATWHMASTREMVHFEQNDKIMGRNRMAICKGVCD